METTVPETLELLIVGMTTVALVLGLVVLAGRLLISAVNRSASSKSIDRPDRRSAPHTDQQLDPRVIAVLSASVEHLTQGQGNITSIDSTQ